MNQLSNYDYSQNLFGNFTNRGGEQTRERSLRSSRGNYESQFKDSLQSSKVRHQNNLSHIKINDLLNYKRDESSINNLSPIDSRERSIHKSNSVRNADSDRNSAFLNKAFQMDELLKLREQYLKLEQKNKELEHALFIKNNEVLQLNQKIETMLVDNNQMRIDHAEIISKKDKTIQNLNLRLKEIKSKQNFETRFIKSVSLKIQ